MSDLSKHAPALGAFIRSTYSNPEDYPAEVWEEDAREILASPVLARIIADAKAEVAAAIEALHYDAPAARIAQATAARIARQGGAL